MNDNQVSTTETTETQPLLEEETFTKKPRSKKWFIIGGALIVFLALAAFLGARLLKPQGLAGDGKGSGQMMFTSKGGPGGSKSVRIDMTPAREVPQGRPDVSGLFVRRQDQSIFVGTGNVRMMAKPSSGGASNVTSNYDGPVKEVVITHQTQVYQDITDMNPGNIDAKNGSVAKIQQIVKPGSLDDLGANSLVTVWGDKQGDRYIARVVVFR